MINLRKNILKALSEQMGLSLSVARVKLPEDIKHFLLHGDKANKYEIKLEYGRGKKAKSQVFP